MQPNTNSSSIQYTEEDYTELYSNLPAGLKDLVLNGRLAILVSEVGVKNGLDADQVSNLESAVEDLCLGIITQKDLADNIKNQVDIDISLARKIASDCITGILQPYLNDINFARNYKLGMDERIINNKKNISTNDLPDAKSLREQILNENKQRIGSDVKMAQFFNKNNINEEVENDEVYDEEAISDELDNSEVLIEDLPENTLKASNFITKKDEEKNEFVNIRAGKGGSTGNVSFSDIISKNKTSNNDAVSNSVMIRFEQELATLTQAINTLIKNTPTGKDFNLKSFEEINAQIKKIEAELKEIKSNQDEISTRIKKLETTSLISSSINIPKITEQKTETNTLEQVPKVIISSVTKEAAETIAANKSNNDFDFSKPNFSWGKKSLNFNSLIEKAEEIKAKEEMEEKKKIEATNEEKKKVLSSVLLKDLANLKNLNNSSVLNTTIQTNSSESSNKTDLKSELLPQTKEERMKFLQDKIRNLNQGK